jgi:SAM-dependent methyltransferase
MNRAKRMTKVPSWSYNGFSDVDGSDDPSSYIDYLVQSNANEQMRATKQHLISVLNLQRGDHVLDAACGVGHDAQTLSRLVGRAGLVVGIDKSKAMIQVAKKRTHRLNLSLEFHVCDAHRLNYPQETFDGSIIFGAFTLFEHPSEVLTQILRVLKPGKRLVVMEPDWDTLVISTDDEDSDSLLINILRQSVRHSGIAHRLPTLFRQVGFEKVTVRAAALTVSDYRFANQAWGIESNIDCSRKTGVISPAKADRLLSLLKSPENRKRFFGAFMAFAVFGEK